MQSKRIKYLSTISLNERIKYIRLLFRWQGSVWKLLWADFLWFLLMYIGVTLLYRLYLINDPVHKHNFETLVTYMNKVGALVPLSFLLGFFVSTILGRWWEVVMAIPWMSSPTFAFQAMINGKDIRVCREIRLTLGRYMNLAWIFSLMSLSQKVKSKFAIQPPTALKSHCHLSCASRVNNKLHSSENCPLLTKDTVRNKLARINEYSLVKKFYGGQLIREEEIVVFEQFESESTRQSYKPDYVVPLMWCTRLLERSLHEGYITSEHYFISLLEIVKNFRSSLGTLSIYTEFNVPLVYTQVVIIVVYTFLISEIFSQQVITYNMDQITTSIVAKNTTIFRRIAKTNLETYFPVFSVFKFLIYMGWFKIGLSLVNPFGNEKSDIPLDNIMDYNLEVVARISPASDNYYPEYLTLDSKAKPDDLNHLLQLHTKTKSSDDLEKVGRIQETNIDASVVPGKDGDKKHKFNQFEIA